MWFLKPDQKAKPLAGRPPKESCPPTHTRYSRDVVMCMLVSKRSCSQGLGDPWPAMFLCVCVFPAQVISFLGLFIWGPWMEVFKCPYWGVLIEERWGESWSYFSHSYSKLSTFLLLALHPLPSSGPQVHKTTGTFCLGVPSQWDGPHVYATLNQKVIQWRKNSTQKSRWFLWCIASWIFCGSK